MSTDLGQKLTQESSSYGYNYGGYAAGGYGEGGSSSGGSAQRTLHDYLLVLRERVWYVVVVFLVVVSSAAIYTVNQPKIYQSSVTVQIFRRDPTVMQVAQVVDTDIRGAEDLNTQMKIIESARMVQRVADRIKGDDLRAFLLPYGLTPADSAVVPGILGGNRKVALQRLTLVVVISYQHQDRVVAAKVANFFAEEYLNHNLAMRSLESSKAIDDLKATVEEQQKRVEKMARELQDYREKTIMVSLDQRKDIVNESLRAANQAAGTAGNVLSAAEVRLNQLKELKAKGGNLTDLAFIASNGLIGGLTSQLAGQKITLATLQERYRKGHPKYVEAANAMAQTERELERAVTTAAAQVESEYQNALKNFQQQQLELTKRRQESLDLDRAALEYNNRERELKTNEQILQTIVGRSRETTMTSSISSQNARIVDLAVPSREGSYISPNIPLNLGLGVVGGLGLGLAFAFFVAFLDDRVKSSYDVEGVVGLPLIGIIPQIKKMEQQEKAQVVINNQDRQVAEAFLTLHSGLRLKEEAKNAKCILTTSTIPGEGKTFCTLNLALTFASHGERVVVVDCDLRKPNVHKSLGLENRRGVIDICAGTSTIEQSVLKNVHPNFDVIPTGGRAKNPTQILNSKGFEEMIANLRKSYDRVFIDTPPLAAVSDALIILPLVDGSVFAIFFNKVRRKAAQFSAKKLAEGNVPVFGAVLNGLNLAVSGYYYAQYYDKSYKDYYVTAASRDGEGQER